MKSLRLSRPLCALLALFLCLSAFVACSGDSEVPDGYQYATCRGEYFRLFIPTQWRVNTESGVSGGYIAGEDEVAVSMAEVVFQKADPAAETDSAETAPTDTAPVADMTATLADFVDAHIAEIATMKGYTSEKSFDATLGSYRAKDITYTVTIGERTYRYRQVLTKVQGRFYVFSYSARADAFDKWLDIVDGILENVMFYAHPFEGSDDAKKIPAVDNVPAGMKLVSNNDVLYRFFVPENWIAEPGSAASLVYYSEEDRSNVSVIGYVPEAETYSVANYWADMEDDYKATLNGYTQTAEPVEAKMGDRTATVYEYTYSVGGVTYKCRQAACVYSYMIVVMTYTALPENYDAHLEDVEAMQAAMTFRRSVFGQAPN